MDKEEKGIAFKGTSEALIIIIPVDMHYDQVIIQMSEKVRAAEKFFRGAKLKIVYRGKILSNKPSCQVCRLERYFLRSWMRGLASLLEVLSEAVSE